MNRVLKKMAIDYEMTIDAAITRLGLCDHHLSRKYDVSSDLDAEKTLGEIILLDPSLRQGITLEFLLYELEQPYTSPIKGGLQIHGDFIFFDSPYWTPEGVYNRKNVFFLLLRQLYGDVFQRESGIEGYSQKRLMELHYSETWKNIVNYSDYGMPSSFTIHASQRGVIFSLRQKGNGFNAKRIDEERIRHNGGAGFMGYRETNGIVFFDSPSDTHEVFFMYVV